MNADAHSPSDPAGFHITGPRGWAFVRTRDEVEPACEALCKITGDSAEDCVASEGLQSERPLSAGVAPGPGTFRPDVRGFRRRHLVWAVGLGAGIVFLAVSPVLSDRYAHLTSAVTPSDIFTGNCRSDRFEVEKISDQTQGDQRLLTGTVRNGNAAACGVRLAVDVVDPDGTVVASVRMWPFGTGNLLPSTVQAFKVMLGAETARPGSRFDVKPIEVRQWPAP